MQHDSAVHAYSPFLSTLPIEEGLISIDRTRPEDLDSLYAIETDPASMQHMGGPLAKSWAQWSEAAKSMCDAGTIPASIWIKDQVGLAGRCALALDHTQNPELEIVMRPDLKGNGYGGMVARLLVRTAFEKMSAHVVKAHTAIGNIDAISLMISMGFVEVYSDGRWRNFALSIDRFRSSLSSRP